MCLLISLQVRGEGWVSAGVWPDDRDTTVEGSKHSLGGILWGGAVLGMDVLPDAQSGLLCGTFQR